MGIKGFFSKIKESLLGKKEVEEREEQTEDFAVAESLQEEKVLGKFDAEFHEPRLQCFYCNQTIESGKVRFMKAPGQQEPGAYHKRCFKKLKDGKLPGQ